MAVPDSSNTSHHFSWSRRKLFEAKMDWKMGSISSRVKSSPSSWVRRVLNAALEPPRDTGPLLEAMTTTSAPSSTADAAVTSPPTPAPMTRISHSTVFVILLSSMGSGGISKFHFAFWNVSASRISSPDSVVAAPLAASLLPCGAHPASPSAPVAAAAAPTTVAPLRKLRRFMGVSMLMVPPWVRSVPAPGGIAPAGPFEHSG